MGELVGNEEHVIIRFKLIERTIRDLLSHHLRNSIVGLSGAVKRHDKEESLSIIKHIEEDLERFGL